MTIRSGRAQVILVATFLVALTIDCLAVAESYRQGAIYGNEAQMLVKVILAIYSIPLGVILGGVFGQKKLGAQRRVGVQFWVALILAIMWNVLLAARMLVFLFAADDSVRDLQEYLREVPTAGLFLVGSSLTYFFTAPSEATAKVEKGE